MRGSEYLKTILKNNNESKIILAKSYAAYYVMAVALYGYWRMSMLQFLVLSIPDVFAAAMLHKLTRPIFSEENGARRLVHVTSLNSPGVISFLFDLMFWGMLCKVLVVFSRKWGILYLGIIVSLLTEFFYKPYKSLKRL